MAISTFQATPEDFEDFHKFLKSLEAEGAAEGGIVKIIPPRNWVPRRDYGDFFSKITIRNPIRQGVRNVVPGIDGIYYQICSHPQGTDSMTVPQFKRMAESKRFGTPEHRNFAELEHKFWRAIDEERDIVPLYGADNAGTAMDDNASVLNFSKLRSILDCMKEDYGPEYTALGVNSPYLYFGMWKTLFPWHTEDMDLYSINYLHFGSPKSWYSIPIAHARKFEELLARLYDVDADECSAFIRHKICVVSPQILRENNIPFNTITQEQGQMVVTFPYGYHAGFNHGFNLAEAVNFATERWVEFGKRATQCECGNRSVVQFSMDTFVQRFQPELYEDWKLGEDVGPHPAFPWDVRPANKPSALDILCNKNNQNPEERRDEPKKPRGRPRKMARK